MADAQRQLGERILEGSSGGGVVEAFVNGNQELQAAKRAAVDPDDVDMLDGLPTAVVRKAMQAAKDLRDREVSKVTGGLNLPGMGF